LGKEQGMKNKGIIKRQVKEKIIGLGFLSIAFISIAVLFLIMFFLFKEGLPIFKIISLKKFLLGNLWYPTDDYPAFGIFPMIVASLLITFFASCLAVPFGVMGAIYMAEISNNRAREWLKPIFELLAAIPSVVIGFIGMVVIAPVMQNVFNIPTGLNMLNASLMLALMAVPTITSISEDAINAVPHELKDASLALGATKWETIIKVVLPASLSGIITGVILGMSRVIGETMVVLMVAGGAAMVPSSLFDPVRPMTASIAAEMGEAPFHSEHYYALFAIGIILFIFTFIFNLIADYVSYRYKQVI